MSRNSQLHKENQKPIKTIQQEENLTTLNEEDSLKSESNLKETEDVKTGLDWFKLLQLLVGLATVATAILGWRTLIEMQTERNNAYQPDIVIQPVIFEGGQVGSDDMDLSKDYVFINNATAEPGLWYAGNTYRDEKQRLKELGDPDNLLLEDTQLLFFETPYLLLKNIGQGTAKNVQVTFSMDWLSNAVEQLNSDYYDEHNYTITIDGSHYFDYYTLPEDTYPYDFLAAFEVGEENIIHCSYISPDEDSIKITLPHSWPEMIAVLFAQETFDYMPARIENIIHLLHLPDLIINIKYTDLQGKPFNKDITIPWSVKYRLVDSVMPTKDRPYSFLFWTGFYEDYLR